MLRESGFWNIVIRQIEKKKKRQIKPLSVVPVQVGLFPAEYF